MKNLIIILFSLISLNGLSQVISISTVDDEEDYYPWITFLSEGETNWADISKEEYIGYSFRFIITTSEIYNNIYIENVTYGMEGCCKKVISKREIPIDELFESFNIMGERGGVDFVEWIDYNSLKIKIYEDLYRLFDIDHRIIKIEKL